MRYVYVRIVSHYTLMLQNSITESLAPAPSRIEVDMDVIGT